MKTIRTVKTCRICDSTDLYDFLHLGKMPIPNGFLKKEDISLFEKKYPLAVCYCRNCSLTQLRYIVSPEVMFKNYLYIPSASQARITNFSSFIEDLKSRISLNSKSLIMDIGSNDGSLLTCFKNEGMRVLGVDPAENLVKVAELNGVPTELGYFGKELARKLVKKYGKANAMFATNVFAHIGDIKDFLSGASILLEDQGLFVSQFPYVLDLLQENQFDTIYHEHLSYFSVKSLLELAKGSDFTIYDIVHSSLDGGSLKVYWKKKTNNKMKITPSIEKFLQAEEDAGLYQDMMYDAFANRVTRLKEIVRKKLLQLKRQNKSIVGYGAAAKGNVLLNYFNIGPRLIDYLVDSTPYKQGRFTPGKHVPIFAETKILQTQPDYVILLAWNFAEEIMKKNKDYIKNGGKFIVCIPEFQLL